MLACVATFALEGVSTKEVTVEVDVRRGLGSFTLVGLPDRAVREARERVRAAVLNSALEFPQKRITVNLAPAHVRKAGPSFDLAIALGLLAATEQVPIEATARYALCGELSLSGEIKPVSGTLAVALGARKAGFRNLLVPAENAAEAALVKGLQARGIPTLDKASALVDLAQSTGFTPITEAFSRNPTLNNWEPRVGVAFDPFRDQKTSIRAGYGIFHSPITANRLGPAYALNPPFALGAQVRLPFPPFPVFPTPNPSASQISQMQALDYDMGDAPRLHQWNVNVQRELFSGTSVTLAYVGVSPIRVRLRLTA